MPKKIVIEINDIDTDYRAEILTDYALSVLGAAGSLTNFDVSAHTVITVVEDNSKELEAQLEADAKRDLSWETEFMDGDDPDDQLEEIDDEETDNLD